MISCFGHWPPRCIPRIPPTTSPLTSDTEQDMSANIEPEPQSNSNASYHSVPHTPPFSSRRSLTLPRIPKPTNNQIPTSLSPTPNSSSTLSAITANSIHDRNPISLPLPREHRSRKRRVIALRHQPDSQNVHLHVGFRSRTGWTPMTNNRDNQDALTIICPLPEPNARVSLFAVFDGHGDYGQQVAGLVAERLPKAFHRLMKKNPLISMEQALKQACSHASKAAYNYPRFDLIRSGTTAAVCAVCDGSITCANIGDSRVIVGTERSGCVVPLVLTEDHSPDVPEEMERIKNAGGRVDHWSPDGDETGPARVWLKDSRQPGLAVSRVIGDTMLEGIVSDEPTMTTHELGENDRFVVIASDGLWNVMTNDEVVTFVADRLHQGLQGVVEDIVKHAAGLWLEDEGETIDDITVTVVKLDWACNRDKRFNSLASLKSWRLPKSH